jgi:hypothetical protein
MDIIGALLRAAGDQMRSAASLVSTGHSEVDRSSVAAFDSFIPPVFLRQYATPALTALYSVLPETARKMCARFPIKGDVLSSSRARRTWSWVRERRAKIFLRAVEVHF